MASEAIAVGRYLLHTRLAVGGMAEVWLAHQRGPAGFAKQVVIKKILPDLATNRRFVEMFQNEARLAALLNHPNIVQIFDLVDQAGSFFIAMEFVHGHSLRRLMQRLHEVKRAMPPAIAAQIIARLCDGLHHAHELRDHRGKALSLVHRDVSPENALISFAGQVKLVDFGIAKAASSVVTQAKGPLQGKLTYLAPEQIRREPPDRRVDVYGLGMVLHELLTGVPAFADDDEQRMLRLKVSEEPPPVTALRPDIPGTLAGIVARALARERAERTPDARTLGLALDAYLKDAPSTANDIAGLMAELFPDEVAPPATRPEDEERTSVTVRVPPPMIEATQVSHRVKEARPSRSGGGRVVVAGVLALGAAGLGMVALTSSVLAPPPGDPAPVAAHPAPVVADAPTAPEPPQPPPPPEVAAPQETPVQAPPPVIAGKRRAPARGFIDVRVNPWAEIRVDRELVGTTPVAPISAAAGTHVVTATNDELGKSKTVRIRVAPSQTTVIRIDLLD